MNEDNPFFTTIAGFSAGVVGTVLGYPFDNVKTRLQLLAASSARAPAVSAVVRAVYRGEGAAGFYRGVASPLVALTLLNTVNFSAYVAARRAFGVQDGIVDSGGFEPRVPLAGAAVGLVATLISTPFELVKTQMVQSNNSVRAGSSEAPRYRNSLHAVRQIASRYGPAALFRGFAVNTAREVAFLSTYFGAYEHAKALISRAADRADPRSDSALLHRIGVPLAGGISGALGWFLSFPLDCVKSQIQGAPPGAERRSAAEIARGLWRAKGIGGFYSGVVPSVARAFLVSSSRFTAYEGTLWLLHRLWGDGWMR